MPLAYCILPIAKERGGRLNENAIKDFRKRFDMAEDTNPLLDFDEQEEVPDNIKNDGRLAKLNGKKREIAPLTNSISSFRGSLTGNSNREY